MGCLTTILFVYLGIGLLATLPGEWALLGAIACAAVWSALDDLGGKLKEGR